MFGAVFFGNRYSCTYCGRSYRRLMHQGVRAQVFKKHRVSGAGLRKNVRCPNCGSNHRSRLLHLFFELRTDIYRRAVRILHVAPKRELAQVFGARDNIDYVCGALFPDRFADFDAVEVDVTQIGFGNDQFDVVICNHVLEHVREDGKAMRELFRVLRPGGFAVLQVPLALDLKATLEDPSIVDAEGRKRAYGQKDHLRLYGLDYFDRLADAGFEVSRDNPFDNRWAPDLERYGLDRDEDVFIGRNVA
jgi:SAM-dependent methyltransferase